MIEPGYPKVSVRNQCELLGIHRSGLYWEPKGPDPYDLQLMGLMDRQYLKTPFYGSRKMTRWLVEQGHEVNRKRVQRLMRTMGLAAIYPRRRTSVPAPGHRIYPYLLRGLRIEEPDQVWCSDLTYIPMAEGWLYLTVVMDWYSRYVLSWELSNSLDADFCVRALETALAVGCPRIFNTDQGSQYTSENFTGVLKDAGIAISMDGRGRFMDNVFVERLWRSLKYEEVYLKAYETVRQARESIGAWIAFYNRERFHQALDYLTPWAVYRAAA
jgi:putative transposase